MFYLDELARFMLASHIKPFTEISFPPPPPGAILGQDTQQGGHVEFPTLALLRTLRINPRLRVKSERALKVKD